MNNQTHQHKSFLSTTSTFQNSKRLFSLNSKRDSSHTGKSASERVARSRLEAKWLQHDRSIYLRQSKNERGEPVFDLHPKAKKYLERDVLEEKHLQMSAAELQASRNAYRPFKKKFFKTKFVKRREGKSLLTTWKIKE